MSELRVYLFGPPRLEHDGSLATIRERKAIALYVYLIVSAARLSRDALATMLWPEQSQSRARAYLRHTLWSLKEAGLGENMHLDQEAIGIQSPDWLDVIEFSKGLERSRQHGCALDQDSEHCQTTLAQAVGLYQDDFLAGFTLRDSPQFDEWQYYQREHYKQMLASALKQLTQLYSQHSEWEQAIAYSQRWVGLDPLNEPAQRSLMRAYSLNNQRNLALRQFETLTKILYEELGAKPEQETLDLAEAIRKRKLGRGTREPRQQARSQTKINKLLVASSLPKIATIHLLERENLIERLNHLLLRARAGDGHMLFLGGEAGGGKTTLIRHFCNMVRNTVRISVGICDPLSTPQPLGPLWDIATELGGELAHQIQVEEKPEHIFRAFLESLRREQIFRLIVFEDVHWADEATLDLLRFIGRRIETTRTLLVASYRDDEIEGRHPLRILLGDLATASGIERMHLPPLSQQAVEVMVAGSGLDSERVHKLTGGNPFFITEMLLSGVDHIPDTVRDAVLVRARRLTPSARSVLDCAAVLGMRPEASLLEKMTSADTSAVEECISAGILLISGDQMEFRHEIARQAILDAISPSKLLHLNRQALQALRTSTRYSSDLARLSHFAEGAADTQAVLEYAPAAARQAAKAGAHRQAAAQYERALRFASSLPADEHALLLQAYAETCHLMDWNEMSLKVLVQARQIWREHSDPLREGDNLTRQAIRLLFLGRFAEANRVILSAIEILSALPVSRELVYAYNQYARLIAINSDYKKAISFAEKAIGLNEQIGNTDTLIRAHNTIGICLIYLGDSSGREHLERSVVLAKQMDNHASVALGYANLGRWSGLMFGWDIGSQYINQALAYCTEYEMDFYSFFMLGSLASAQLYQGLWAEAEKNAKLVLSQQKLSTDTHFWAAVVLGRVQTRRGGPESASTLDMALELAERFGTLMFTAPVRAARAEAAWLAGDLDHTLEEARSDYELAVTKQHIWYVGELGFWLWRAGEKFELSDWAMPVFARQIQGDWQGAAEEWERRGQPFERALALADGNEKARSLALQIFNQLGAAPAAALLQKQLH